MSTLPVPAQKPALPVPIRRPRLKRGDHEFLPAALEILETPVSPVRSAITLTICAFVAATLAWSYIGRIDIIATAQGKIQPVGRTKTIQPLDGGRVLRLPVENGKSVKAGDVLLELDPSEARADEAALTTDIYALRAEVLRRRIALDAASRRTGVPDKPILWDPGTPAEVASREERVLASDMSQLASSIASYEAERAEKTAERERLKGTIAAQSSLVATLKERVDMRAELLSRNAESKAHVIDAQESYQTQVTALAHQQGQIGEAEASIVRATRDIDKSYATFIADNAQKLAEAERKIAEDNEKLSKAKLKTSHMVLTSPIDGIVQGLTITTLGQVVQTGEQVMQVVPRSPTLEIECYLPNGDIGFVKPGQPAVVKVDSFPFTDYGTLDATVTRVAEDAIPLADAEGREENPILSRKDQAFGGGQRTQNLVFPVTLSLAHTSISVDGAPVPLGPGMAVTVEVKTGTRRILSYVFSPLLQVVSTAMKER